MPTPGRVEKFLSISILNFAVQGLSDRWFQRDHSPVSSEVDLAYGEIGIGYDGNFRLIETRHLVLR